MSNGPNEQNHLDSNAGGQEGGELHGVAKLPGGENLLSSLKNIEVLGSTTMRGVGGGSFRSKRLLFGSTQLRLAWESYWQHSFLDEVSPMKEHAFITESAFS